MTTPLVTRSHRYWHLVFAVLVLAAIFVVVRGISSVLTPVAAALVVSYLLDPLVTWMARRFRIPRWAGTLIFFLLGLFAVAATLFVVVPLIGRELHSFAEGVPGYIRKIRENVLPYLEQRLRVTLPHSANELMQQFGTEIKAVASKVLVPLGGVAGHLAKGTAGLLSAVGTLILVPVFIFYFLPKFPSIVAAVRELIPMRYRNWVDETARQIDRALAAWIRGQITVMAVQAVLYSIGLSIVGLKMAVFIGTLTGFLAFVPYVGVIVGATLAVAVALLEYSGPGQLIGVAIVFGIVQVSDAIVLTPYLVGEKVGLGPVGVLLALMLGGKLFGFVGVLLAVPTAAALVVVIRRGFAAYRDSAYFKQPAVAQGPPLDGPPSDGGESDGHSKAE